MRECLREIKTHRQLGIRSKRVWNACWLLADGVHKEIYPND